jgi:hypothetical protein
MLAENRLCENSMWDDRLLAEHFKELSEINLDFELEITGFDIPEIDLLIQRLTPQSEQEDPADSIPDSRNAPVVTDDARHCVSGRTFNELAGALEKSDAR